MKKQYLALIGFLAFNPLQASNLIDESLKAFPPGSIDRISTPVSSTLDSVTEVTFGDFKPTEPRTEIERLLKAIQDRKSETAIMPGTQVPKLEDQLVVELAREVIRLKEENQRLSIQIEALSKK